MNKFDIIKQTIRELLKIMGFDVEVSIDVSDRDNIIVSIYTEDAGFLIGQGGSNLRALQHIARILIDKKMNQSISFILDVNDYRKHRLKLLKKLAEDIASQVMEERVPHILSPMSPYERRIIHLTLSRFPNIKTESIGEEPERKVVIKPKK
ncbi:KH domain-containing protein [bacterium]|nr:KH domain-containing protein [bacterium]